MLNVQSGEGAITFPNEFDDLLVSGEIAGPGVGALTAFEHSHKNEGEERRQQTPQGVDQDRIL
jgi:hypothetical protein